MNDPVHGKNTEMKINSSPKVKRQISHTSCLGGRYLGTDATLGLERQAHLLLGQSLSRRGDYQGAARAHSEEVRVATALKNPRWQGDALEALGDSAFKSGQYDKGAAAYKSAITIAGAAGQPPYVRYLERRLNTQLLIAESDRHCIGRIMSSDFDAAEAMDRAVPEARRSVQAILCLASALEQRGQMQSAIAELIGAAVRTKIRGECMRLTREVVRLGGPDDDACRNRFPADSSESLKPDLPGITTVAPLTPQQN